MNEKTGRSIRKDGINPHCLKSGSEHAEKRMMKKNWLFVLMVLLLMVFCLVATAENGSWDCPECGKTGNTGKYCSECAHPAPTAPADEQEKPSVPVLSEMYPGKTARLRTGNGARIYSYFGPGEEYKPAGGYTPEGQKTVTVFFEENGYVLADVQHESVSERYVYLPKDSISMTGTVPAISELNYYHGTTKARIMPGWGPAIRYDFVGSLAVDEEVSVKVFFQENGFVYGEYTCGKGTVRMWLPADHIDLADANVTCSDVPIVPAGESSYY